MSSEFEWRIGDDLPKVQGPEERGGARRWLALLLLLLLAGSGAVVWWRGRQRNLAQAEAQVRQLAQLELRALAEGDADLYLALQDPADRSWKAAQEIYLDTRGLPLPLQDLTTPVTTTVESARIVGDRARVTVIHTAALAPTDEAVFQAVRFYRYTSDGRWLHTEADPDYGGDDVVFIAEDLEITVFANDPIRMDEPARQLADLPYRFCSLVPCRRYAFFGIDSTDDPEFGRYLPALIGLDTTLSVSLAANLEEAGDPGDTTLPASFLVGAPSNAAAQDAWEAALGQFLVDHLITREMETRPADEHGALVEERLRAWLKAKLGVSEPVSPNLDIVREALDNGGWIPLWRLWQIEVDDPDRPLAAAEVDLLLAFVEGELGPSAVAELLPAFREASSMEQLLDQLPWAELLHPLRETSEMEQVLNPVPWPARSSVELQFPAYVRERTATSSDDLSTFASYDLLVGCSEEARGFRAAGLWGWRHGAAEPVLLAAQPLDESLVPVSWSPDGTQLLLQRGSRSAPGYFLLQSGSGALQRMEVPNGANPGYLGPSGWSPDGSRLAYPVLTSPAPGSIDITTRIVDVETGNEIALDGQFVGWSPDGSRMLYTQPSGSKSAPEAWLSEVLVHDVLVAQRDGTAVRRIGEGYAAAWSPGGERIATISGEPALDVYDLSARRSTTLLDRDALGEALDLNQSVSAASLRPFRLAWSPDGEWIALGVTQFDEEGAFESIILLARPGEHRQLRQEFGRIADLSWAPDGRWVHLFLYHEEEIRTRVFAPDGSLLLREQNAAVTWSPDGRELALTRFGDAVTGLQISDVRNRERQQIDVPGTCRPPVWNPRFAR